MGPVDNQRRRDDQAPTVHLSRLGMAPHLRVIALSGAGFGLLVWPMGVWLAGCQPTSARQPSLATIAKPVAAPPGMVLIKGGEFVLGNNNGFPDERPERRVKMSPFWMDDSEVTNAEFEKFVEATGYVTTAEKPLDSKDFPGVDPQDLQPGAAVFTEGKGWAYVPGANWKHPEGPTSSIKGRENHPVVQVSWDDAVAYAKWAGKRLPTEAEWEYAAKGGMPQPKFVWGDQPSSEAKPQANIWQGEFPKKNLGSDKFRRTAPVRSFAPNRFGLYDMAGNVWEWCSDFYRPDAYKSASQVNPQGPKDSLDPDEPGSVKRVTRGGSFLCAENYCRGYRPTARMKTTPDTGLCHTGFRCVKDLP